MNINIRYSVAWRHVVCSTGTNVSNKSAAPYSVPKMEARGSSKTRIRVYLTI